MVELAVEGEPAVAQSLDEVGFPQRAVSVEQAAVPPRGQLEQLADPSRRGQRRTSHVIVDVDVIGVVVGPCDVGDSAERPGRVLPESGLKVAIGDERVADFSGELRPGALRRLEKLQSADVHRVLARFDRQKYRVERTHQFHGLIKAPARSRPARLGELVQLVNSPPSDPTSPKMGSRMSC